MNFICDAMLAHLGRQLRAAGHDTWIEDGSRSDNEILEDAIQFDRIVLTCSRKLQGRHNVIRLASSDKFAWARLLNASLPKLNWLAAPFTRCLDCNTPLTPARDSCLECKSCKRIYWHGSHVDRMQETLRALSGVNGCA